MNALHKAPADLPSSLQNVVDYRKSGLSLNHVIGCPLDCGYCVRHLFNNYEMKRPHLVMSDEDAISLLMNHWAFRSGITPIQIFNRATDPFLPGVKDHLFNVLETLDAKGLSNTVLIITRWRIEKGDIERLERLKSLRLTILVTWSGIEDVRIEPVNSAIAEESLKVLSRSKVRTKSILYWRPLIAGLNDTDNHLESARRISLYADATVFTGLFYRDHIRAHFRALGVEDMYEEIARRKILPRDIEQRVLSAFSDRPIFRKTSCGVAFSHGISDYNGHYGIREICDICPKGQIDICARAHHKPNMKDVLALAELARLETDKVTIDERKVQVSGSSEQQRYFIQHMLNYQVHDSAHPHLPNRHGRAEAGWRE